MGLVMNQVKFPKPAVARKVGAGPKREITCSIVIVAFHSLDELRPCLKMLRSGSAEAGLEIIVVNNSQADAVAMAALCASEDVLCRQNSVNLGYGAACNLGAARAQGRFVLFMNPDVRISPASLQLLVDLCENNTKLVAIGPLQGDARGRVRGKRRSVGQVWTPALKTLRRLSAAGTLQATGFLGGGVLMVRKDAFDRIGGFDENVFLFHEDDDLCLRLATQGQLAYASGVLAVHYAGKSTPPSAALTEMKAWHLGNSKVYVARKHYGKVAAFGPLLEAAAKFVNPAILTSRGRIKARAFLAGAWSAQSYAKAAIRLAA